MSWTWAKDWANDADYPYDPEQAVIDARRKIVREQRTAYEETIKAEERERIIKLLESDPEELLDAGGGLRAGYEIAIALIKGEK